MKYRIIARIEDDSFNNEESEIMGYMVVDERGKTNIGTIDKICRLYQQGKIEGAEFKRNNEVTLRNIDDSLIPIFNMSAFSNSSDVPVYMISECRGDSYVIINKASGESAILAGSRIIAGVLSGQYKIGNARVTNGGIDYRDSVVVLSTLKKNGNIGYSIMTSTGEIKQMSKKDVIEGLIEKQGKKLLNAKIVDGKLKAKDGSLPVVDYDEIERKRKAEEVKRKAEEEAKRKAEEEAKRKAEEEAKRKAEEMLKTDKERYGRGICDPKRNYDICIRHSNKYDLWIKRVKDEVRVAVYTYVSGANINIDAIRSWDDIENKVNVQKYIDGVTSIVYQVRRHEANCTIMITLASGNILNIFDKYFNDARFNRIILTGDHTEYSTYAYNNQKAYSNEYKVYVKSRALYKASLFFNDIVIHCVGVDYGGLAHVKILNYCEKHRQIVLNNAILGKRACYGLQNKYTVFLVTKNDFYGKDFYDGAHNGYKSKIFAGLKTDVLVLNVHGVDIEPFMFAHSTMYKLEIHSNIGKIKRHAFYKCMTLKELRLHDIEEIEDRAFGDSGVETVYIANSVKKIHPEAFAYCKDLKVVYYEDDNILSALNDSKYMSKNVKFVKINGIANCYFDKYYNQRFGFDRIYQYQSCNVDTLDLIDNSVHIHSDVKCNNLVIKDTCTYIKGRRLYGKDRIINVYGSLNSIIRGNMLFVNCIFKNDIILHEDVKFTFKNCKFEKSVILIGYKTSAHFNDCEFVDLKFNVDTISRNTLRKCKVSDLILGVKEIKRDALLNNTTNNIIILSNIENYEPYAIYSKDIGKLYVPKKILVSLEKTLYYDESIDSKNSYKDLAIAYSGDTRNGYITCFEKLKENGKLLGYKVRVNSESKIFNLSLSDVGVLKNKGLVLFDIT